MRLLPQFVYMQNLYSFYQQLKWWNIIGWYLLFMHIYTLLQLFFFLFSCNITYWSCCCCWLTFLRYRYEVILTDNKNNNIRRLLVYVFFSLVVPAFSVLDAKINNNNNNISVSWCLETVGTFQLLRFGSFKRVVIHVLCINLTYSFLSITRKLDKLQFLDSFSYLLVNNSLFWTVFDANCDRHKTTKSELSNITMLRFSVTELRDSKSFPINLVHRFETARGTWET